MRAANFSMGFKTTRPSGSNGPRNPGGGIGAAFNHVCIRIFPLAMLLALISNCRAEVLPREDMYISGHRLRVEIADEREERVRGLKFRRRLAANQGMLFVYEKESKLSFWMEDTVLPLSIAFIASDGTIREIRDMEPLSLDAVRSGRNVRYALEVNQGWFRNRGIKAGDKVQLPASQRN